MRYVCVTLDYDGTLARHGSVAQSTIDALPRVRTSGRKLILATGRELPDLLKVFAETQETTVLELIREMSLELQIIFNKNAVMILPSGVNKGSGVLAALNSPPRCGHKPRRGLLRFPRRDSGLSFV